MFNRDHPYLLMGVVFATVVLLVGTANAVTSPSRSNTLHLCGNGANTTICTPDVDFGGGVVVGTTTDPLPTFNVVRSPNTNQNLVSPQIVVVALVPNLTGNESLSFTVNGTGVANTSVAASLFSSSAWTSGFFASYIGQTRYGGPQNPLNAWLGASQVFAPGATGYYVYTANMGAVNFSTADPSFSFSGLDAFPAGTIFMAYILDTQNGNFGIYDATAPSSALLVTTPEPASVGLLGLGLLFLGVVRRRS